MALIPCTECGNEVSTAAKTCPRCGARVAPPSNTWKWVVGVPAGLFAAFMAFGLIGSATDPQSAERQQHRRRIELCMSDMNDPLRGASFREAARSFCERDRDEFVRKYGRQP